MPGIKIQIPESFRFVTEIEVRITDVNYGGHLGNDSLLSLIHEARVRFLKNYGFSELDIGEPGIGIIMRDCAISFRKEAFYGDRLEAKVDVGEFSPLGCEIYYLLERKQDSKEIARAKTGIVFFDYQKRKPVKTPVHFLETFRPADNI